MDMINNAVERDWPGCLIGAEKFKCPIRREMALKGKWYIEVATDIAGRWDEVLKEDFLKPLYFPISGVTEPGPRRASGERLANL